MRPDAEQYFSTNKAKLILFGSVMIGPLVFLSEELVTYIFVPWACSAAGKTPLYLMNYLSLVLVALGGWNAYRSWRDAGRGTGGALSFELGGVIGRTRFIGFVGMLFSGLFFLAIVATSIPNWIMSACHP
jgi:hypothetical protein